MTDNETIFCIECRTSVEQCFCVCPYCGEKEDNCLCNIVTTKDDVKDSFKYHSTINSSTSMQNKDDDWWRLEKWQFGRRNFP